MLKINYAWARALLAAVVLGLVFILPATNVDSYCPDCDADTNFGNASVSTMTPDITIMKISDVTPPQIVDKFENLTFNIFVYSNGEIGATINITDVLPSCFRYVNSSVKYRNASGNDVLPVPCGNYNDADCGFTITPLSRGDVLLKWQNLHIDPANKNLSYKPRFWITVDVTSQDCYGNYTNYVNYTGVVGVEGTGSDLKEIPSHCKGNYTSNCQQYWYSLGYPTTSDCINECSRYNEYVNSIITEANASIFINGTPHINLPVYKYAPENSTPGENFTYNITFTVLHPYGNSSDVTLIDNLPPQVSLIGCNDYHCECDLNASIFNCIYNDLPNGTTKSIEVLVHVDEDAFGNATNYAHIQAFSIVNSTCNMTSNNYTTNTTRILSGYISGVVFNDTDGDGSYSELKGDIPFANYPLNITDGVRIWSVSTLFDGTYNVLVPFGNYNITTIQHANMKNTTPSIYMVDVNESKNYRGNDFGFKDNYGYISGIVFNDTDGSGDYNSTYDSPIVNHPVNITNGTHTWTVNTSPNGTYSILVPFGTYNVTTVQPENIQYTTTTLYKVVVNETLNYTGNDFGFGEGGVCPYEINPSCYPDANITVLINGVETYSFGQSGRPYNVTVIAKDRFGVPIPNLTVRIVEKNGHNPFALTQKDESNVTNYLTGETYTNSEGRVSFAVVPTGGITSTGIENYVGNYGIKFYALADCGLIKTYVYNVTDRELPNPNETLNPIPNKNNLIAAKEYLYQVYDKIRGWLNLGGGENHNVTIYTNGTAIGMPITAISGKPTGLHVTLKHPDGTPVPNAKIIVTEKNGHNPFALTQTDESNVTNYMIAETYTADDGRVNFTIVPTGGITSTGIENYVGSYNISLEVYLNNTSPCDYSHNVYSGLINNIDRQLPNPTGDAEHVPNENNQIAAKEYLYQVYDKIRGWLAT